MLTIALFESAAGLAESRRVRLVNLAAIGSDRPAQSRVTAAAVANAYPAAAFRHGGLEELQASRVSIEQRSDAVAKTHDGSWTRPTYMQTTTPGDVESRLSLQLETRPSAFSLAIPWRAGVPASPMLPRCAAIRRSADCLQSYGVGSSSEDNALTFCRPALRTAKLSTLSSRCALDCCCACRAPDPWTCSAQSVCVPRLP